MNAPTCTSGAGCMQLPVCQDRCAWGEADRERHQYCPDEAGLCMHDAAGLAHECPAMMEDAA